MRWSLYTLVAVSDVAVVQLHKEEGEGISSQTLAVVMSVMESLTSNRIPLKTIEAGGRPGQRRSITNFLVLTSMGMLSGRACQG